MMARWTLSMPYTVEAESFFRDHAGFSVRRGETERQGRDRCARELAIAELWARNRGGLIFEWEDDPDADLSCACGEDHGPAYGCIVRRMGERDVLASLWGIQFGEPFSTCIPLANSYARVVQAELADQVLNETRERDLLEASNPELRALIAYAS